MVLDSAILSRSECVELPTGNARRMQIGRRWYRNNMPCQRLHEAPYDVPRSDFVELRSDEDLKAAMRDSDYASIDYVESFNLHIPGMDVVRLFECGASGKLQLPLPTRFGLIAVCESSSLGRSRR